MKTIIIISILLTSMSLIGQGNCNIYQGECKAACELSYEANKGQGSKHSQELFDSCIVLCPSFAYAYFEKSVPYLKQGLFKEWKILIDKAVQNDPSYKLNRGCNQIQFIRNYEEGVKDLDQLVELKKSIEIGFSPSGEYHAQLLRAICYQKMGNTIKAIELAEELIDSKSYYQGLFDFFHIGIIYLDANMIEKSKESFDRQIEENEFAEIYFYYSKLYGKIGEFELQRKALEKADNLYRANRIMENSYYHYIDKVFQIDITEELNRLNQREPPHNNR